MRESHGCERDREQCTSKMAGGSREVADEQGVLVPLQKGSNEMQDICEAYPVSISPLCKFGWRFTMTLPTSNRLQGLSGSASFMPRLSSRLRNFNTVLNRCQRWFPVCASLGKLDRVQLSWHLAPQPIKASETTTTQIARQCDDHQAIDTLVH